SRDLRDGSIADGSVPPWRADWGVPEPGFVEYRFAWDRTNVSQDVNGSWEVTSNLGFRTRVNQGWIVNYTASFVPCKLTQGVVPAHGAWYRAVARNLVVG
ncbi:MAG: hypothetical protein QGF68_19165, partial [Nitrospinota bacterium]|nr:hypothetical protein [Nitrospinota bacterium]